MYGFYFQKTNIQQLKEEIREKMPEPQPHNNGLPTTTTKPTTNTSTVTTSGTNASTTGTLKHRKNRPAPPPPLRPNNAPQNGTVTEHLEIRGPNELLFGVPSTLKTQWRHQPKDLVTGSVTYVANVSHYLWITVALNILLVYSFYLCMLICSVFGLNGCERASRHWVDQVIDTKAEKGEPGASRYSRHRTLHFLSRRPIPKYTQWCEYI